MSMWDPESFDAFEQERMQPAVDLANRLAGCSFQRILDVGCGSGLSTIPLVQRWPEAAVVAIDVSESMIAQAKQRAHDVDFIVGDALVLLDSLEPFDLIFTSGFTPWIDDQIAFFEQTFRALVSGGISAHQIPLFQEMPSSDCIWEALRSMGLEQKAKGRANFLYSAQQYYDIFAALNAQVTLWVTDYYYTMATYGKLLEFLRSGSFRPYVGIMSEEERAVFEARVMEGIERAYKCQSDGTILYPFRRIFIIAQKP